MRYFAGGELSGGLRKIYNKTNTFLIKNASLGLDRLRIFDSKINTTVTPFDIHITVGELNVAYYIETYGLRFAYQ